jgi:adenosylmethionine-8-amino-7-oxononanoate aminotransferase
VTDQAPIALSADAIRDSRFWHPFSNMPWAREHRLVLVRGDGAELFDRDGKRYLDATACLWYCAVGHGRREMAQAIARQAEQLAAYSCFDLFATDTTLALADRVAELAPLDDAAVFLTSGGSDSVDTAAKIARRYWAALGRPEKQVIVSRDGAYHGMHAFGTSLAGIAPNREGFGDLIPTVQVPRFDVEALRTLLDELGSERVAAFYAEPVIGAGGVHPATPEYWQAVARLCRERDVLFVADEVITGFGRTGHWFASERLGAQPDLLIAAKAITSGYVPLGAVVVSGRVAEPFWAEGSNEWLRHGYTYSGHATACAAALANLAIIEREGLVEHAAAWEPAFAARVRELEAVAGVSEVRTLGLLAGIQLDPELAAADPAVARLADAECRRRGVLSRPLAGNTLLICPSLVMRPDQLDEIVEQMAGAIDAVTAIVGRAGRAR